MSEEGTPQEQLAGLWEVETRSLPSLCRLAQAAGARPAGPSSILEKFLNYLLAGDQKPEQAWAGPAG